MEQQTIIDFLQAGKAVYLEGTDFGKFHFLDPIYALFGCSFQGDGDLNGVQHLDGQGATLMSHASMEYLYNTWPDYHVDYIESRGGEMLFRSQEGYGRAVAYAGADGTYRAIHSAFVFGAMKDAPSSHTKTEIMAAYMGYLSGHSLVAAVDREIPADQGAEIVMLLEAGGSEAGRDYVVLGSATGTSPGIPVGSVTLPLNFDPFMRWVIQAWNSPSCAAFLGKLDAEGRAAAVFSTLGSVDPGLAGLTLDFSYLLKGPVDFASNALAVPIIP